MSIEHTMVNELLSYLYGSFMVTYVLCVIGILIKEVLHNTSNKPRPISLKRIIFASIPVTAILCAVRDRFDISFSIYVLLCLLGGACSGFTCNIFVSNKLPLTLIKSISKIVKDPMVDALSKTAEEVSKKNGRRGSKGRRK